MTTRSRPSRSTTATSRPRYGRRRRPAARLPAPRRRARAGTRSSTRSPSSHTVYAPDHPGTGETARDAIHGSASLWDLVLIYDELLDALGLASVPLVGASFGGMVACEVAAHRRAIASAALVLLDPIGLWRDDAPVAQYMMMTPDELVADAVPELRGGAGPGGARDADRPARARDRRSPTRSGRWVRPASSCGRSRTRGLKKRLHRVNAPTLIVWGEEDALISSVYAQEFAKRIAKSQVEIIRGAGHVPQWEQLETVHLLVTKFLHS